MKKSFCVMLVFVLLTTVAVAGCILVPEEVQLDLPFEVTEVNKVEVYHYDGVPTAAEKKVVTNMADIEDIYTMFEQIPLQNKETEELTGSCVAIFRFILSDGTEYEIIYTGYGVKDGMLKSNTGNFHYFTYSDIGGYWKNLPYEAIPVGNN